MGPALATAAPEPPASWSASLFGRNTVQIRHCKYLPPLSHHTFSSSYQCTNLNLVASWVLRLATAGSTWTFQVQSCDFCPGTRPTLCPTFSHLWATLQDFSSVFRVVRLSDFGPLPRCSHYCQAVPEQPCIKFKSLESQKNSSCLDVYNHNCRCVCLSPWSCNRIAGSISENQITWHQRLFLIKFRNIMTE